MPLSRTLINCEIIDTDGIVVLSDNLRYALQKAYEVVEVVWDIPFFWLDGLTFGDVFIATFVLLICFRVFVKIFM